MPRSSTRRASFVDLVDARELGFVDHENPHPVIDEILHVSLDADTRFDGFCGGFDAMRLVTIPSSLRSPECPQRDVAATSLNCQQS